MVMASTLALASSPDERLDEELAHIRGALLKGRDTDLAKVDLAFQELTSRRGHTNAVYFAWAEMFAQAGQKDPAGTIERCRAALAKPQPIQKVLRLRLYAGDAMQVRKAGSKGRDLVLLRRLVAEEYLDAIAMLPWDRQVTGAQAFPELPRVSGEYFDDDSRLKHEAALKRYAEVEEQNEVASEVSKLVQQVTYLYTRRPYFTEEFDALASKLSPTLRQAMLAEISRRIERRSPGADANEGRAFATTQAIRPSQADATGGLPHASPTSVPEVRTDSRRLWLALGAATFIVTAVTFALIWRRRRAK